MTTLSGKVLNEKEMKILAEEKIALEKMLSQNVTARFGEVRNASLVAILSIENKRGFNQLIYFYLKRSLYNSGSQADFNED